MEANRILQVIIVIPFEVEEMLGVNAAYYAGNPGSIWRPSEWDHNRLRTRGILHGLLLQRRIINQLKDAARNNSNRFGVYALGVCVGGDRKQIYTHSKTMIVDDTWAIIGSSNANGRGFVTDGESNIVIHRRSTVTQYRRALWREHIGIDIRTRRIREFAQIWQTESHLPANVDQYTCEQLTEKRVCQLIPPEGVPYDGPASSLTPIDDYV
jgi:phosphatidylserine/phosphatidylglycerophosphate/cardiolipin synthase-like enzyme